MTSDSDSLSWCRPYEPPLAVWLPTPDARHYQLLGENPIPIATHFLGRTIICPDPQECPACSHGYGRRVTLYMWARTPKMQIGLLSLPHQAGNQLPQDGHFGKVLSVKRLNKYRVDVTVVPGGKVPDTAPLGPITLLDAIARLHTMPRWDGQEPLGTYSSSLRAASWERIRHACQTLGNTPPYRGN